MEIVQILCVVAVTWWRYRVDFASGLATTIFFLFLLPTEIRISTGTALPEITVHRILLMISFWQTWRYSRWFRDRALLPGVALMVTIALGRLCSTLIAVEPVASAKEFLSFLLEYLLFFLMVGKGLRDRETVVRVLRAVFLAGVIVALLGIYEKYRGTNLVALVVPGMVDNPRTVTATYRHRILFGYAMAMAFPLAFALRHWAVSRGQNLFLVFGLLALPAACYFGNSRGPWVGLALAGGVLMLAGSRIVRRHLCLLAMLAGLVLVALPGVQKSIQNRWEQTFSTDTHKGRSASYRLELWTTAWQHLTKSPGRFLFGYGGGSTEHMQLDDFFQYGGGSGQLGHTSWDSEYASDFMKYGTFGLSMSAILLLSFVRWAWKARKECGPEAQDLLGGCLAVMAVFVWAMSNVAIFNPQLQYLFLTMVAIALRYPHLVEETADTTQGLALTTDESFTGEHQPAVA